MEKTERPYIVLDKVELSDRGDAYTMGTPNNWFINFRFKNVGKMPAICKKLVIKIADRDQVGDEPEYNGASEFKCKQAIASEEQFEGGGFGPDQEIRMKGSNPIIFHVFGRLTYTELTGEEHTTGFIVEVSPIPLTHSTPNKPKYEYYT
jgi:hypothetical protein